MSTAQLPAETLAECRDLALEVARELDVEPLYIENLPANYPPTGNIRAFCRPGVVDYAVRESLIERGAWRGPGSMIIFCGSMTREDALATTLHELGHLLPARRAGADVEPTATEKRLQDAGVALALTQAIDETATEPRWLGDHGQCFVRRCLHLHFRAWRAGFQVCLFKMSVAGWRYDLSPCWRYKFALGDEPERMASATFAEIEAAAPPAAFTALYQSDVAYWHQTHKGSSVCPS